MFQKAKNLFPRKEKSQSYGFLHKFFYPAKKDETLLRSEIYYLKNQLISLEKNFLPPENIIR